MSDATSSSRCDVPINDFSALAGKLQETAEAVLAFCRSVSGEAETPKEKPLGEYRQYRLPAHTLREEKELLERYEAESFANALHDIHAELYTTVFLMKGYDDVDDVDSFHIHLLGEQLERSLDMLSKACSVMADYNLVHVMYAPAP